MSEWKKNRLVRTYFSMSRLHWIYELLSNTSFVGDWLRYVTYNHKPNTTKVGQHFDIHTEG
jgi:hypothetical protein